MKSELQEITNRIAKLTKNIEKAKTAKEQVWIVLHINTSMDKCLIYQIIDCDDYSEQMSKGFSYFFIDDITDEYNTVKLPFTTSGSNVAWLG